MKAMVQLGLLFLLSFVLSVALPLTGSPLLLTAGFAALPLTEAPQALLQQGLEHYEAEQYFEAVHTWQQASQDFARQQNVLGQAFVLSHLSLAYQHLGQLERAQQCLTESQHLLNSVEKTEIGEDYADIYAKVLNSQGKLYWLQGQLEAALMAWQSAAERYAEAQNNQGVILAQLNQARAFQALGLNRQAEDLLRQVYQEVKQQPDPDLQATGFRHLAGVLRQVGEVEGSRDLLQASLSLATQPANTSLIYLELGNTERALGDRLMAIGRQPEAQTHWQAALRAYQQAVDLDQASLPARLNWLNLLIAAKAIPAAQEQWPQIERTLATLPPSRATVNARINLASNLMQLISESSESVDPTIAPRPSASVASSSPVSPTQIAQLLATAIQQARALNDHRSESYGLGQLGQLYEQMGQWSEAQSLTRQALARLEALQVADIQYRWEWQLGRLERRQGHYSEAMRAYENAVYSLQQVRNNLLSVDTDVQFSFRDNVEPVYRQYIDLLLTTDPTAQPQPQPLERAIQSVDQLQLAELENYLGCTLTQVGALNQVRDPNAAIVYPIVLRDRVAIITELPGSSGALNYHQSSVPQAMVETTLAALRNNLASQGRTPEVLADAQKLYDWVMRPLEAELAQAKVSTLVFVLDGALRNIPMAVLHDGEHYLIEKGYAVAIAPRLQLFTPTSARPSLKVTVGGVGIPQEIDGAQFPAIDLLSKELEGIARHVDTGAPLLDEAFTTENIQQQLQTGEFSAIHWKTHGIFSSDPQETYIVAYTERIAAAELRELISLGSQGGARPLELLVLSACETAQGDDRAVLGLAGLATRTGTRSVLSTLWIAQDTPNTDFMVRFYQGLAQPGMSKAEAVRQAQLSLMQEYGYTTPYIWANYVLIGNWL